MVLRNFKILPDEKTFVHLKFSLDIFEQCDWIVTKLAFHYLVQNTISNENKPLLGKNPK